MIEWVSLLWCEPWYLSVCIQLMDILQGFVDMKLMMDKPERGNQKLLTEHYKVDE